MGQAQLLCMCSLWGSRWRFWRVGCGGRAAQCNPPMLDTEPPPSSPGHKTDVMVDSDQVRIWSCSCCLVKGPPEGEGKEEWAHWVPLSLACSGELWGHAVLTTHHLEAEGLSVGPLDIRKKLRYTVSYSLEYCRARHCVEYIREVDSDRWEFWV
jgi:hypothetical protein